MVGLTVVYPGVSLEEGILVPFRVVGLTGVVSLAAFLALHLRSHGIGGRSMLSGVVLSTLSSVPLVLLLLVIATLVATGIVQILVPAARLQSLVAWLGFCWLVIVLAGLLGVAVAAIARKNGD